ncbi:TPA: hypothetical protein ACK0EB_002627 [Staphylococcus aureus]
MSDKFSYIPNKEVLENWFAKEYIECITHDIKYNSKFIEIMNKLDERAKDSAIEYMAFELFYKNNSSEYIKNHGDGEVYEVKQIIAERISIDEIYTGNPNIVIAMMEQKEFIQMLSIVNDDFMEYSYHLKLLIHNSTFIQIKLFGNKDYSSIEFLDNGFAAISSHDMPTNFIKHLVNVYNSKEYKDV